MSLHHFLSDIRPRRHSAHAVRRLLSFRRGAVWLRERRFAVNFGFAVQIRRQLTNPAQVPLRLCSAASWQPYSSAGQHLAELNHSSGLGAMKTRMTAADIAAEVAVLKASCLGRRVANVYDTNARTYLIKLSKAGGGASSAGITGVVRVLGFCAWILCLQKLTARPMQQMTRLRMIRRCCCSRAESGSIRRSSSATRCSAFCKAL